MISRKLIIAIATIAATALANNPTDTANFDVFHGTVYNSGVQAGGARGLNGINSHLPGAAITLTDLINTPYLYYNRQLVGISPTDEYGSVAFNSGNSTTFLHLFRYSNTEAKAILGVASKSFGVSFAIRNDDLIEFSKEKSRYDKTVENTRAYENEFSFQLAMPLKDWDLTARAWFIQDSYQDTLHTVEYADADGKQKYTFDRNGFTYSGLLAFSNRPSAKNFSWKAGAFFNRFMYQQDSTYRDTEDHDNDYSYSSFNGGKPYTFINAFYAFSTVALKGKNARALVGGTVAASTRLYDKARDKRNHREDFYMQASIDASPNFLAEYVFNEHWMVWNQSVLIWANNFDYEKYIENAGTSEKRKNKLLDFESATSNVLNRTGLRFEYNRLMLEATLSYRIFNNPFVGFDDRDMLTRFEAFYLF